MWDNTVGKRIKGYTRKLFILNAVTLGLLLWWAHAAERYLYNCWQGPMAMSRQSLEKIANPDSLRRYYISVPIFRRDERGCAIFGFSAISTRIKKKAELFQRRTLQH